MVILNEPIPVKRVGSKKSVLKSRKITVKSK